MTVAETRHCATVFESLLQQLLKLNGNHALPVEQMHFALFALQAMIQMYCNDLPEARYCELSRLGVGDCDGFRGEVWISNA